MQNPTTPAVQALVVCDCGCGEAVSLDLGTFSSTTCELGACSSRKAAGIASLTLRKSAGLGYTPATSSPAVRHASGLVAL